MIMQKIIRRVEFATPKLLKRKKVAAYARVSADTERMQHSLSAQVSYYSRLIQNNPEWEYAGVYADYGISGTGIKKRQEFRRMIQDAEDGKIDIILTKSVQRFARNTLDLLRIVRHLKKLRVEVRFEKENIHTMSSDGELMLTILASFAQEESRSISDNVKWRVKKFFEKGLPYGHPQVYGYRWEGDSLVLVPEEAAIVKRIFQNFMEGKSRLETERELNAEGIRTRKGCRWQDSNLKVILTNITYTGNLLLQKEYISDPINKQRKKNRGELPKYFVENTHEAIIDKATFDYVQKEMARRKELGPLANKSLNTSCFTGKIKCGICGKSFVHSIRHDRGGAETWGCASHKWAGNRCTMKGSIPQSILQKECMAVLGINKFDDKLFLEKIDKILVPEQHTLVFYMKNGEKITRQWISTAKKDCWNEELKNRQRAWMRNYMANCKNSRFYPFSTRIRCAVCGASYRRVSKKHLQGLVAFWRCPHKGGCESINLEEKSLERLVAEALRTETFDEDIFREKVDYLEVGREDKVTIHFQDGKTVVMPYEKLNSKR